MTTNDRQSRRRVLALMPGAYGAGGGIAQFNRNLLEALGRREDLELQAIGLSGTEDCDVPPGIDWSVPRDGSKAAFACSALARALRARPELIISGHVGFGPVAWPLKILRRSLLWTVTHGIDVWDPGKALDNAALRGSDIVTAVSRYTRERLRAWSGINGERLQVLHNTIDLERFRPGPRPEKLIERYGVRDKRVVLTVSRLAPEERYKGHDRIIPLMRELDARLGGVHYVIAGTGADQPRLESLARSSGAERLVTFTGFVPLEELEDHYRLADVMAMPSTGEGFGIVFLEAMACGCPVVAGNRDGSADALADGELGRLVDPDDPEALRESIAATLEGGRRHDRAVPGVERFAIARFRERVGELVDRVFSR